MNTLYQLIGNTMMSHMSPPNKHIGALENILGKTIIRVIKSRSSYIKIIIYLVVGLVIGFVIGLLAKLPIIGIIIGLVGGLIDLYVLIGIILLVLDYLKILK
jgi:hypothetical protein